jgi:hypothetical protein
MVAVATYPDSTKTSLEQRLNARARERWPQITSLRVRHRGSFSYVDATLTDATTLKLCRLRYVGSAHHWQFAIAVIANGSHCGSGPVNGHGHCVLCWRSGSTRR